MTPLWFTSACRGGIFLAAFTAGYVGAHGDTLSMVEFVVVSAACGFLAEGCP